VTLDCGKKKQSRVTFFIGSAPVGENAFVTARRFSAGYTHSKKPIQHSKSMNVEWTF